MIPARPICLVTDRRRLTSSEGPASVDRLVDLVCAAAQAGVDMIQLRERDLSARDQFTLARHCLEGVRETGCRVLVNDRVDIALAAAADGVHLRGDSFDGAAARALAGKRFMIGRSVHGEAEAGDRATARDLDYLLFGTVFPTASKPALDAAAGLDELAKAVAAASLPVLAIGGITLGNAGAVVRAGAAGIAAIGLFIPPPGVDVSTHVSYAVQQLRRTFDTC